MSIFGILTSHWSLYVTYSSGNLIAAFVKTAVYGPSQRWFWYHVRFFNVVFSYRYRVVLLRSQGNYQILGWRGMDVFLETPDFFSFDRTGPRSSLINNFGDGRNVLERKVLKFLELFTQVEETSAFLNSTRSVDCTGSFFILIWK